MSGMSNRVSWKRGYVSVDISHDGIHDTISWYHRLMNGGSISVVSRMTGFGYRDIETGYRSPCGKFWLASGLQDIRQHLNDLSSEEEMIEWVKRRANTCVAMPPYNGYPHLTYEKLVKVTT